MDRISLTRTQALFGALSVLAVVAARLAYDLWHKSRSPLCLLRGPRHSYNLLMGHTLEMITAENNAAARSWREEYGGTFSSKGHFGKWTLVTTDHKALSHVLLGTQVYSKVDDFLNRIFRFIGPGLLFVQGVPHRHQRRILDPGFGYAQVRAISDVFSEKAVKMCDIWKAQCVKEGGAAKVNALFWLTHITLDIIGKAGFGHEFHSLDHAGKNAELAERFGDLNRHDHNASVELRAFMGFNLPFIRTIMPGELVRLVDIGGAAMFKLGEQLLKEKKQDVLESVGLDGKLDKNAIRGKDILSLAVRANMAEDLDPARRLTDKEVIAQVATFVAAGHDTSANTSAWILYELATHKDIQKQLREELQALGTDTPSPDALNALPLLDQVVRETLRLHALLAFTLREATQDDVIPIANPVTLANGEIVDHIKVQKGDQICVPIDLVNTDKAVWGPDADEFRPSRWMSGSTPKAAATVPGITPNILTFLGGPHACIGHRFAVMEMKTIVFEVVTRFEFDLALDKDQIWARSFLPRPQLRGTGESGMPLAIRSLA